MRKPVEHAPNGPVPDKGTDPSQELDSDELVVQVVEDCYEGMNVKELRDQCLLHSLPATGKKVELIARLRAA